ncbi:MAG: peptidase S41 [Candidatus Makaraimicrobium thalassicum]|nr:MAG: peptidase S41 [Candidatus Omnitrophota bacterium]
MKSRILTVSVLTLVIVTAVLTVRAEPVKIIDNSRELFKQIQLFADSVTLISTDYVEPIKVKDLVYGAIKGMMSTLDGYSQFLDPESFREITEETKGEFGGLGIEIGVRRSVLTVIAPMDDTPASAAGILAGDVIVKIDGEITRDMTLNTAVRKLRGTPGTKVDIGIIREGVDEMLDFTITRAIIKLESIKDACVIEDGIGYVRLVEFQQRTPKDLRSSIKKLRDKGVKGLILDLRNNPGGLLDAAVKVADQFLEQGVMIVYTEGRDPGKRMEFRAKEKPEFDSLDLVIVVNKGSASASEILAGAVKDNGRGLVIGVPTFGKGSVQTVVPLNDKSALRLTTAAYFTPAGKSLIDKGIDPDIYVERVEVKTPEDKKKKDEGRSGIFTKLEKTRGSRRAPARDKPDDKGKKAEAEKPEELKEYDNQIQTAVNILKGVRISERRKVSHPPEEKKGRERQTNG